VTLFRDVVYPEAEGHPMESKIVHPEHVAGQHVVVAGGADVAS
jgi:hypothetical protein